MSEFFARPWLVLAAPLIFWVLKECLTLKKTTGWTSVLPPELAERLLTPASNNAAALWLIKPFWVLAVIAGLLTLALAGLGYPLKTDQLPSSQQELVIIQYLSPPLPGQVAPQEQLETSQRALIPLLNARREGKTALIYYAASAHLVSPVTDDTATLRQLFSLTHPSIMPLAGDNPEAAFKLAADVGSLAKGKQIGRLDWLWLTPHLPSQAELQALLNLKPARAQLYLVWLTANQQAINKELKNLADLGIVLLHPNKLQGYTAKLNQTAGVFKETNQQNIYLFQELSHWPLLLAMLLLLWQYLGQPRLKSPIKLRFWLLILTLNLSIQEPLLAAAWQNSDYQARQAILAAKADKLLPVDKKLLAEKALKLAKRTDLKAHAEFLLENYSQAAKLFAQWQVENPKANKNQQAKMYFNTGTAWLLAEAPSQALEAFKQAKALQSEEAYSEWPELCINKKLAELELTKQAAPTRQKLLALCGASSSGVSQEEAEKNNQTEEDWQPEETSSLDDSVKLDTTQEKQLQQLQEDPWRLLKHRFQSELREQGL